MYLLYASFTTLFFVPLQMDVAWLKRYTLGEEDEDEDETFQQEQNNAFNLLHRK